MTDTKIPVGKTISNGFDWLTDAFGPFFDFVDDVLSDGIDGFLWLLQYPPALLIVAMLGALTYYIQRSWAVLSSSCCASSTC